MEIRISIVDDHPMIINGFRHMLSAYPHIIMGNVYQTGSSLLEGLQTDRPDVLLLDIQLPDMTGDKLVKQIIRKFPEMRILALTSTDSALYIYNVLNEGALGYILKSASSEEIVGAIETVAGGERYLDKPLNDKLERFSYKMRGKGRLKPTLTAKEKEVLVLTVQGYTSQEISERIFLALRTVEYYRSNLLLKFQVRNIVELTRKTIETGLLDKLGEQ